MVGRLSIGCQGGGRDRFPATETMTGDRERWRVVVRGSGDVGAAVAHRLFGAGFAIILHDGPESTTSHRTMPFTDAVFDGRAVLVGITV